MRKVCFQYILAHISIFLELTNIIFVVANLYTMDSVIVLFHILVIYSFCYYRLSRFVME